MFKLIFYYIDSGKLWTFIFNTFKEFTLVYPKKDTDNFRIIIILVVGIDRQCDKIREWIYIYENAQNTCFPLKTQLCQVSKM